MKGIKRNEKNSKYHNTAFDWLIWTSGVRVFCPEIETADCKLLRLCQSFLRSSDTNN